MSSLAAALGLVLLTMPPAAPANDEGTRRRLEQIEKDIANLRHEAQAYAVASTTILGEIERLDHERELSRREIEAAEARLTLGRDSEAAHRARALDLEHRAATTQTALARSLVRLYQRGGTDWVLVLLGSRDPTSFRSGLRYLARLSQEEETALATSRR